MVMKILSIVNAGKLTYVSINEWERHQKWDALRQDIFPLVLFLPLYGSENKDTTMQTPPKWSRTMALAPEINCKIYVIRNTNILDLQFNIFIVLKC